MAVSRIALFSVLGLRIAYGAGLIAAPDRLATSWLGPPSHATRVALRGLGAREVVLHGLALAAALHGKPVRPFLAASIAGDLSDIAATTTGREGLPAGATAKTAVVAGGSAALTAGLLASA